MPNFVEELVDDLVTQTIASAKGTDIFYDELPEEADLVPATMMVLKDTGGVPSPDMPVPISTVQILVRSSTSWIAARAKAAEIYNRYHGSLGLTTTSYKILHGEAVQLPGDVGVDERSRYRVSFHINFEAMLLTQDAGGTGEGYGGGKDLYNPLD
jgi:hypothetical protein